MAGAQLNRRPGLATTRRGGRSWPTDQRRALALGSVEGRAKTDEGQRKPRACRWLSRYPPEYDETSRGRTLDAPILSHSTNHSSPVIVGSRGFSLNRGRGGLG